jgi:8-oxo-dGTP diphosphatase
VKAAGCVVWRANPDKPHKKQVLVIHRPHRSDWTHPKGKLDPLETELECALREVAEETGVTGRVGAELPLVEYSDHRERPKAVRYWLLEYQAGEFKPNNEVDKILWLSPKKAAAKLTYAHDVELLDHL